MDMSELILEICLRYLESLADQELIYFLRELDIDTRERIKRLLSTEI